MKASFLWPISFVLFASCQTAVKSSDSSFRKPASADELIDGSRQILADISNSQVFTADSCPLFVEKVTDYLYRLPADYFVPKNADEVEKFKTLGPEIVETVFKIRVQMRERMQQFDTAGALTDSCTQKIREGLQYARFTEEYVLDWLYQNQVFKFEKTPILTNARPNTWTNPKFEGFKLKTGDVMIIRGKSYVSAMIARIGDEEGNFSHVALITEDSKGRQYVTEALIQYGVTTTPLDKWLQQEDARVALYRQPDEALALKAGRLMYDHVKRIEASGGKIRYDFAMDDDESQTMFCSEVAEYAYDKASGGELKLPKFRTRVTKFEGTDFLRSLGVKKKTMFAPFDMEVDPRFDFVAESRFYPLLRQVRMQDAVLQSIYMWMSDKKYEFGQSVGLTTKAYMAKFFRQFGFLKETLPSYMPMNSIKTNVQFQALADMLEKNIYKKEQTYFKEKGYLPSFSDLMAINEEYRSKDCREHARWERTYKDRVIPLPAPKDPSDFHWFFSPNKRSCE